MHGVADSVHSRSDRERLACTQLIPVRLRGLASIAPQLSRYTLVSALALALDFALYLALTSLAVGPTDDPSISRITLTLDGAVHPIDQVTKQLHKLVNVLKIRDMEPEETVAREMAMFKVSAAVENRAEIIQFAEIFRAKIVDVSRRAMTIEVTGSADKIEAFERMIRPHGLIEMVRTGEIAIARGAD